MGIASHTEAGIETPLLPQTHQSAYLASHAEAGMETIEIFHSLHAHAVQRSYGHVLC